jgi:hypothetical protein
MLYTGDLDGCCLSTGRYLPPMSGDSRRRVKSRRGGPQIGERRGTAAVLASYLIVAGCRTDWGSDLVEQERRNAAAWTLPVGGAVTSATGLRRSAQGAEATWELSAPMTWERYRKWLEEAPRGEYRRIGVGNTSVSFSRLVKGDQFLVDIAALVPSAPMKLRVTFTGRPD